MELNRFDRLSRVLAALGPRRGVFGLVTAVPVVRGLLDILSSEETDAAGRRKRRKKAHKHGRGRRRKHRNHKKKKPACTPTTCRGGQICQGDGTCCLPETADLQTAITGAASGATLRLCAGTWNLTSTVVIARNLTLIGAGTGVSGTILDGGNAVRVLQVEPDASVTLQDLTITKGRATGDSPDTDGGGGISNAGTLTLRGVLVSGNEALFAGGIDNRGGTLTLQAGSKVMGNSATVTAGGGIFNSSGTITLQAGSSVTDNTAFQVAGGIFNSSGTVTLQAGSRVSGNSALQVAGIFTNGNAQVMVEADALVCSNTPLEDQCFQTSGTCPNPSDGLCPSE